MTDEEFEEKLVQLYRKAIDKLNSIIQKKRSYGSLAIYERSLLRQIREELKHLRSDSQKIMMQLVEKQFENSMEEISKLEKKTEKEADNKAKQITFSRLDKEQIQLIVSNANSDLNKAIKKIGRRTQDIVRKSAVEVSAEKTDRGTNRTTNGEKFGSKTES